MFAGPRRVDLRPGRIANKVKQQLMLSYNWQFVSNVAGLIWEYRAYALGIVLVTIFQELAALWPVSLLGEFVDRLQTGDLGHVVWLLMGASVLYPSIVRGNVILRHKMFYETDFRKSVEMILHEADRGVCADVEAAGSAHTRVMNAVAGITNATYHVLGSFTPVIIKIIVVAGNLLAYNRTIGLAYLASLTVPTLMTLLFNRGLRVLRDAQYSVISDVSGAGVRAIAECENLAARSRFSEIMRERKSILTSLVSKSQYFLGVREVALVGSQFLVVFLALHLREEINLTPGDFTKIVGYTTQVAAAFIGSASVLDAIISYTRAYHALARTHG